MTTEWRNPSAEERAIMERLLQEDFVGVDELREQFNADILVRTLDPEGSIAIKVLHPLPAPCGYTVVSEGEYSDTGSADLFLPRVHILLHVMNGLLHELEFYKDDGTQILRRPLLSELDVVVREPRSGSSKTNNRRASRG